MRKYEGEWHVEQKLLFPDCVILESTDEDALSNEIRRQSERGNISRACSGFRINHLRQMNQEEEAFLRQLYGEGRHLGMSKGIIQEGVTQVTEGPLKGFENRICKIDRHKRIAKVKTLAKKEFSCIQVGLEIVAKS